MKNRIVTTRLLGLALAACLAAAALPASANPVLAGASFADLSGRPVSLDVFKGKVTVVNFWATWCAPCREEMPMLDKVARELKGRGMTMVGIALDQPAEVRPFVKQLKISYPVWMGDANTMNVMRGLGNPSGGLPYTVVLDRDGKVVARLLGAVSEANLRAAVEPRL
ncbi:TlpA family protein disulfide reductase [Crenobacter cavernae]|uniref:TlpA family protein disulfide reductase n=1 Tax=Crenobacter cavernae TaxID=2290923 RepID=A0ABY0FEJ3_9NEIS|nr:TlpA disulfide reductase family protein [Crenobacter cavernae]RXZ44592.1 TlpA family protein disulfide reductase [Crenobacter cavernae]